MLALNNHMEIRVPSRAFGSFTAAAALILLWAVAVGPQPPATAQGKRFLTGQLLVATPEMRDPHFTEAVIYIVRHDEEGAMGFVVNRPVEKRPISELLGRLGIKGKGAAGEIMIHYGGPVESGKGFFLHSDDYTRKDTEVLRGGLSVTADIEILNDISMGKGPRKTLLLLGYAGWAPGQLEAEIKAKSWFTIPPEEKLIFDEDAENKWERARDRRKIKT